MRGDPPRIAAAFAATLRDEGLVVPTSSLVLLVDALAAVGLERREGVYWAGRASVVRRHEEVAPYDRAFARLWLGSEGDPTQPAPVPVTIATDDGDDSTESSTPAGRTKTVRYSTTETLRLKDFADYDPEELAELRRLFARLRLTGSLRRSRRLVTTPKRRGPAPDLRGTVRAALRSSGEAFRPAFRDRSLRPRRVVLLCDVSGSMDLYSRVLIRFVHAAVAGRTKVEAFTMGTRLTRVTRDLRSRDPDAALRAAAERAPDWSGGTRLGAGIREFNDAWGVRGMARGSVVVILSDGWDRGDPAELGREMERLGRVAHRVVWVNPLKASAGYSPVARGMAAALPHVDHFVEGHSLESLEALADLVAA